MRSVREIHQITSRDNQRLTNARKVRDGKSRDQIFIEGRRLSVEALRSDLIIEECLLTESFRGPEFADKIAGRASKIARLPDRIFASIADTEQSQGIVLLASRPQSNSAQIESNLINDSLPLVIFLNEINNPANLGAIIRTAEAAGVAGVVTSTNSVDVFSPKALRASMGSSFRMPIWENVDFDEILAWSRERALTPTAADISAKCAYIDIDWKIPRLLVFGSEAHGLDESDLKTIEQTILIPMENGVESLNVGVSAGILLFEAKRQNL